MATTAEYLQTLDKVQAKYFKSNGQGGIGSPIEIGLISTGDSVPPWWSPARDKRLYQLMIESDHLGGIAYTALTKLANIPLHFLPRDRSVTSQVDRAETFTKLVRGLSEGGEGLRIAMKRYILDYLVKFEHK